MGVINSTIFYAIDKRKPLEPELKKAILEYLRAGEPCAAYAMSMKDRETGKYTGIECLVFRDGEKLWTADLIYHFDKYDYELPKELLDHVKRKIGIQ